MFHLLGGPPHRVLRDLAKQYGSIIHLQLGEVSLVVVTSPDMAKQVLKTHDLAFASRPMLIAAEIVCYNGSDIVFSPYGDYWRQMRKICIMELLSAKNVKSFNSIRQDEVLHMIEFFDHLLGKIMDVHHELDVILENIINEHKNNGELGGEGLVAALLRVMKEGGHQFPITNDNIKAIIFDIFGGGTETSSATIDWTMVEMMRNPNVLSKAQAEVRNKFKGKETFDENDVEELKYLKLVVKESFRLHPPFPLLLPRECREEVDINGYTIPLKTKVMVNAWAIGRDPKYWNDAESFKPERFEDNSMDFVGNNFEYLPFGSGRRNCPGISFGLANVYFPLAQLLYHFDWKLPSGINPSDLDLTESAGLTCARKSNLYLIAAPHQAE
uniref:Elicitor-inducible cytochrome P450 n=1 Tax=Solanum tuberosum TaxID=4113 RepID=M0ZQP7_SOLTU